MKKSELIEAVHDKAGEGLSRKTTAEVIDATFKKIQDSIVGDDRFFMPGFGTFAKKHREARTGLNPRTKQPLEIPSSNTVGFKVAAGLKNNL